MPFKQWFFDMYVSLISHYNLGENRSNYKYLF